MTGSFGALIMVLAGLLSILGMFVIGPILLIIAIVGFANQKAWAKKVLIWAVLVVAVPLGISSATYVGRSLVFSSEDTEEPISYRKQTQRQASANQGARPPERKSYNELEAMIEALPTKLRNSH